MCSKKIERSKKTTIVKVVISNGVNDLVNQKSYLSAKLGKINETKSKTSSKTSPKYNIDESLNDLDQEKNFKFNCDSCDFHSNDKSNYNRHIKNPRHDQIISGKLKTVKIKVANGKSKNIKIYECEVKNCAYKTSDSSNFKKHKKIIHNKTSNMTRDEIFLQISKNRGRIKKIKSQIEWQKDVDKKEELQNKLKDVVDIVNIYVREFNKKENNNKILVKDESEIEEQKNSKAIDKIIKEIEIMLKPIRDLGLDPNDQMYFPESFDGMTYEELDRLRYEVEDLVTDKNLINEWLQEKQNITNETERDKLLVRMSKLNGRIKRLKNENAEKEQIEAAINELNELRKKLDEC